MFLKALPKSIFIYFTPIVIVLTTTFILWLPFLFRFDNWYGIKIENSDFKYVYAGYDGPLYVIPAKTLYDPDKIDIPNKGLIISLPLSAGYFAAHLPFYPILIRLFAPVLGYLHAMIFVNILSTSLLAAFFLYFLRHFKLSSNSLLLVGVFLMLPRFLVVRSVGAPETLFMFLILTSLFFFEKKNYLLAGILGALSVATKTPGILLVVAYGFVFIEKFIREKKIEWKGFPIVIIPLGLLAVFLLYLKQYGDFFAYFHSGDNLHLVTPFSVFNAQKPWVGTAWLEDILFYFFLYGLTIITLKDSKHRSFFYFPLVYFIATLFVQHRDIARYSLPLWPFACIAFSHFFTSKKFLTVFLILSPAIFFYAWNFMVHNIVPIADWSPYQ